MAEILKGAPVAAAINEKMIERVNVLKTKGVNPCLAILRVGEREEDLSYVRGALKRCDQVGVAVKNIVLPADVSADEFFRTLQGLNDDKEVHGILMLRPLPKHIYETKAMNMLSPAKDVDGCTMGSLAGVFTNTKTGFAPCTAQAAMEILHFYGIDPKGKKAAVIGRSLVIGRPVSMMLMHENATVTTCHTKTVDVPAVTKDAEILVTASGVMESVGPEYVNGNQVIIDVGISWNDAKQKLCGDVKFDEVEPLVKALTPVPGGVGAVTTSVLVSHVVDAAERTL